MKSAQFFEMVMFSGAQVVAMQDGSKGFKLVATLSKTLPDGSVSNTEMVMDTVNNEPRYFKSVASIPEILREKDIFSFSVVIEDEDIKKRKRAKVKPAIKTAVKTASKAKEPVAA